MGRNPLDHMNERIARLRRLKPSVVEGVEAHVASIEGEVAEDAPRRRPRGRPATKVPPQAQKPAESALSNGFLHLDDQTPVHTGIESLAHAIGMSPTSLRQLEPLLERRPDGTFPTWNSGLLGIGEHNWVPSQVKSSVMSAARASEWDPLAQRTHTSRIRVFIARPPASGEKLRSR